MRSTLKTDNKNVHTLKTLKIIYIYNRLNGLTHLFYYVTMLRNEISLNFNYYLFCTEAVICE